MSTRLPLATPKGPDSSEATFSWHADCRHFVGGLPCRFQRPCPGCGHHDPIAQRVLIVMLGLLGDMLIASALPARIKRDNPATHITWLVDSACAPVLRMNPAIDRVLPFDWHAATHLTTETFDAIYCFERTPSAASLVERIRAPHKAGLAYGGAHNGLYPIGSTARHFFLMNTWNDYRTRHNTKTWTELYFEVAGYHYDGEPYVLQVPPAASARVLSLFPPDDALKLVCLNVGGSLATKIWPASHWLALGRALLEQGHQLVLTGGPTDAPTCASLQNELNKHHARGGRVHYTPLSIEEFAAVPAYCDVVVTGDSFGFHLALAHQRPCVLLLGPSNGAEVIPKHATHVIALRSLLPCSPCAHQVTCGGAGGCMDTISPSEVLSEVTHLLQERPSQSSDQANRKGSV